MPLRLGEALNAGGSGLCAVLLEVGILLQSCFQPLCSFTAADQQLLAALCIAAGCQLLHSICEQRICSLFKEKRTILHTCLATRTRRYWCAHSYSIHACSGHTKAQH